MTTTPPENTSTMDHAELLKTHGHAELLAEAAAALKHTNENLTDAALNLSSCKQDLADAEAFATSEGLLGKNAEERKADLHHRTAQARAAQQQAEAAHAAAKLAYENALTDHQTARYLTNLHIAQLEAQTN